VTPDFEFCDFAMTTAAGTTKNWHTNNTTIFQYYGDLAWHMPSERESEHDGADLFVNLAPADAARVLAEKTKFCAFVVQNHTCQTRNRFLEILSAHMRVEAGGRTLRSLRHAPPRPTKLMYGRQATVDFYRPYKFVIAFENSLGLHYTTEKLGYALRAHTVPIYWGNANIVDYFNPERFINALDFDTLESLARHVMRVHKDDALYLRYLSAPIGTPRQRANRLIFSSTYENFLAIQNVFHATRENFLAFWAHLPQKIRKDFLEHYAHLMTGRKLPLAQRRMFHRECLARFAHGECDRLVKERLKLTGVRSALPQSGRHFISRTHVWPDPAFYQVVDLHGRLSAKE